MKKDLIFAPIMLAVAVLLALYSVVGKPVHIAVSVVGVLVLAVYTAATKKEWKIPALEILMRLFYGLALISGIVIMNVQDVLPLTIGHKVTAALFAVLLIVVFIHKLVTAKKASK